MISAETTSRGFSSRPRCLYRAMTSWQIKLGRRSENSKAASLALSIKASEGLKERVRMESAGADAAGGGSGQGGSSGCLPRFKMGGPSEQAGVLWDCDCDCGEDPPCAFREIGAIRTRASSTSLRQLELRPESKLRMIYSHDLPIPILRFRRTESIHRTASVGAPHFALEARVAAPNKNEVTALGT